MTGVEVRHDEQSTVGFVDRILAFGWWRDTYSPRNRFWRWGDEYHIVTRRSSVRLK